MKKVKFLFILALAGIVFVTACNKEELNETHSSIDQIATTRSDDSNLDISNSKFTDTSNWELEYVYDLMMKVDDDLIINFLNNYGQPLWEKSIQKRSQEIKITTIPVVNGSSLTGVIKVYTTIKDSINVDFFSVSEIDEAISLDLTSSEYHLFRGAIQSLILVANQLNHTLDDKYFNWLLENKDRVSERLTYYCIEHWDCDEAYTSSSTGWSSNDKVYFFPQSAGEDLGCTLLYRECWVDYRPRNFPHDIKGGGVTNGGNSNNGGHSTETQQERIIKSRALNEFIDKFGLSPEYFDILYECMGYLNFPYGYGEALMSPGCVEEKAVLPFLEENPISSSIMANYLANNPNDKDAEIHVRQQALYMLGDSEYKELVESSISWTGPVWTIIKELAGDKIVDILFKFIPGFNQADDIKDAIKAAKNGDMIEFTGNVGKIIVKALGKNTPLGKLIETINAAKEVHAFYKKISKINDAIGNFTTQAIERLWNIAKKTPIDLRSNATYLKYVGDLETPRLGNGPTVNHRTNFDKAFPNVRVDMEVHHAIPQRTLGDFPQLGISRNQMHSIENLRGIPNTTRMIDPRDGREKKLHTIITNRWEMDFFPRFIDAGTVPTQQQMNAFAKAIDDDFGYLFNPPIR